MKDYFSDKLKRKDAIIFGKKKKFFETVCEERQPQDMPRIVTKIVHLAKELEIILSSSWITENTTTVEIHIKARRVKEIQDEIESMVRDDENK